MRNLEQLLEDCEVRSADHKSRAHHNAGDELEAEFFGNVVRELRRAVALEQKDILLSASLKKADARVAKLEALLAGVVHRLEGFAKIEVPAGAGAGVWVAKTLYCNDQITADQVLRAQSALIEARSILSEAR